MFGREGCYVDVVLDVSEGLVLLGVVMLREIVMLQKIDMLGC